jgi:hypothetical protein
MTLMFCSFEREPMILRIYGEARAVHAPDEEWPALLGLFPPMRGARNAFVLDVELVLTSCGYGVPQFEFSGQRDLMDNWAAKKGDAGLREYQQDKNRLSLDGLPTGLPS